MKASKGSPVSHTNKVPPVILIPLVTQVMKQMNSLVRIPEMEAWSVGTMS